MPSDKSLPVYEALQTLVPELAESEDERARKWLLDYAIEMIAGLESDISLSNYDGIKGHDPEAEAELAQWQKARAYLEKQKDIEERWLEDREGCFWDGVAEGRKQKEQKPAAWSEGDENMLWNIISIVGESKSIQADEMLDWLKSLPLNLKKKNEDVANLCSKEWSEEDERMRNQLIYDVECHKKEGLISAKQNKATKTLYDGIEKCYDEKISWLKSLRPSWKPSEEQMEALKRASMNEYLSAKQFDILISLYEQLKQL